MKNLSLIYFIFIAHITICSDFSGIIDKLAIRQLVLQKGYTQVKQEMENHEYQNILAIFDDPSQGVIECWLEPYEIRHNALLTTNNVLAREIFKALVNNSGPHFGTQVDNHSLWYSYINNGSLATLLPDKQIALQLLEESQKVKIC